MILGGRSGATVGHRSLLDATLQVDLLAPSHYEITIKGKLGRASRRWFADLDVVSTDAGGTLLRGWFEDQAHLRGLLNELADLGVEIRSVEQVPGPP